MKPLKVLKSSSLSPTKETQMNNNEWGQSEGAHLIPLELYAERNDLTEDETLAVMVLGRPSTPLRKNLMKLMEASTSYAETLGVREPLDSI